MSSGFGPGFQDARSRLYRAEYAVITLAMIVYLVWRSINVGGVDWVQLVFWAVFPDLVSFIPIGASTKMKQWPPWGSDLYNFFHNILVWGGIFAASWVAMGVVYWPLFGWLGHITTDRAFGYSLRARPTTGS